ncbi:pilus assembly protein TadG-related protein [Fuscibacter oryzae]|uniref:VWFA domain-containing protein n=1 Tax=Fuscibacter oryzae TaxID=2803939 RepID=A0A8J7MMX9_9RHOB|nr:pilus assembly protein TadG-related protein [Fuscibacter oryzae]MBL4927162.1 hypothetical protein [Fuscibacter oryzae]
MARFQLRTFARQESGSLTIFSLSLFMAMIMIGGLAVDVMRYETIRTNLQNTLDRSTLAAASLTQELDATSVVNDYFTKAGLIQYLKTVTVNEGLNYREVAADATAGTDPIFLKLMGINAMDAAGHSKAEQRVTNVEIMLVLDISGSMASNSKLTNLKSAANEFVNTVLSSDAEGRISIGLVPFNGQVNLGSTLSAKYNLTDPNGGTNQFCVDLDPATYSSLSLSRTSAMSMTANADSYSTTNQTTSYVTPTDSNYGVANGANLWCPPSATNIVRLPSKSISGLQSAINGLTAIGATSINAGMRWGTALLDPSARTMFSQFITSGAMPSEFQGRPFDYVDDDAMKVIILMTDGEHFAEERIKPLFKSGYSIIFRTTSDNNYSVFHSSKVVTTSSTTICNSRPYWVPHLGAWHSRPWNGTVPPTNNCYVQNAAIPSGVTNLTWPQVWANMRVSYVAWQFYARALGTTSSTRTTVYNDTMTAMRTQTATTTMDTQLQTICTSIKNQGVTVYGIAFEAPANGQTQIAGCASSAAHYFNATGLQIKTAFRAIASNISQLRLTQ